MPNKTHFFVLGATGYIGGTALDRFLHHPNATNFKFTALVRSAERAEKLRVLNVEAVVGSHQDTELVEKLASEADVILSLGDSDDLPLIQALLRGSKKRHEEIGIKAPFIHVSGLAILNDDSYGMYATEAVVSDLDNVAIENLPPTQLHRHVDIPLVAADEDGYVKTYIVVPGFIYGLGTGKLVEAGIQRHVNKALGFLFKSVLDRDMLEYVGEGKNIWSNVEINDLADLFVLVYDFAATDPSAGHGRDGYYFAENGEASWAETYKPVAEALYKSGKISSPIVNSLTQEETDKYYGPRVSRMIGGNTRCTAARSRSIGWKPVSTTKDMLQIVPNDVAEFFRVTASQAM